MWDAEEAEIDYASTELSEIEQYLHDYGDWNGRAGPQPDGFFVRCVLIRRRLPVFQVPLRVKPEGFPRASWRVTHHDHRSPGVRYTWYSMPCNECSATNSVAFGTWEIVKSVFGVGITASFDVIYRIDIDVKCRRARQRISYHYPAFPHW